ncbi:MAG: hypothetical protein JKY19_14590 [Alcanivoracaceae bacterium]|nr:hypothetical protein [Alcanivoracaceae bacterium]
MKNIFIIVIILAIQTQLHASERRIALVIGNAVYDNDILSLSNPENDATDMAQTKINVYCTTGMGFILDYSCPSPFVSANAVQLLHAN